MTYIKIKMGVTSVVHTKPAPFSVTLIISCCYAALILLNAIFAIWNYVSSRKRSPEESNLINDSDKES